MNDNDKKILELKEKISQKKIQLKKNNKNKKERLTNLRIEIFQFIPSNIGVLSKNHLNILSAMIKNIKNTSEVELFTEDGYTYTDILIDIDNILSEKRYSSELDKLKLAEKKLEKLLTAKVQTGLEIDNIANELNIL